MLRNQNIMHLTHAATVATFLATAPSVAQSPGWSTRASVHGIATAAYDLARQRFLVNGEVEWDGTSWRQIITTGERGSGEFIMAYDPSASSLVKIGSLGSVHRLGVVATVAPRGIGCAGTGAAPCLTANAPSIGSERMSCDVVNSQKSIPCIYAVSPASMNLSLGSGCTLYVAPPILTSGTVTNASGFAELGFALPFDPTMRGVSYHTQAFVLDPASLVLGLAFTNAVQTVIGN